MVTGHYIRDTVAKLPVISRCYLIKRLHTERQIIMLKLRQLDELRLLLTSDKATNLVKPADTITVALFV